MKLSIEKSQTGHFGFSLRESDCPAAPAPSQNIARKNKLKLPELSELAVVRHFTNLSQRNYSIDGEMYPLGSCTMKYNPRINEKTSAHEAFLRLHPATPAEFSQGALEIMHELQESLKEISGFQAVTLQPAAGAQGEYVGIRMFLAYHQSKNRNPRDVLIPESSHGTNCATAAMCGYNVVPLKTNEQGLLDLEEIKTKCKSGNIAGIMITNPSTLGLFEKNIAEISKILHSVDALVYCDGANMNAMLGLTRPGDAGVDVMHFNLHKTFTTPHGGGGPGCGGVGVAQKLVPFLPTPVLSKNSNGKFVWNTNEPLSIGRIKDHNGHFLMMVRALTYIKELGHDGLKKASQDAILLANYIRKRLEPYYKIAFDTPCMHEVIFTDFIQKKNGVKTLDIAKRLIDLGYHPPTVYFPLVVDGALMIEPTETESLESVENFCLAMIQVAEEAKEEGAFEKYFKDAPRTTQTTRVDETLAARNLVLSWKEL